MAEPGGAPFAVLILAPSGRNAEAATALLARDGIAAQVCASLDELCDGLGEAVGAVLIEEEVLAAAHDRERLSTCLDGQPAWSDLPVVVLTRNTFAPRRELLTRQLPEALGNVMFLERPLHAFTLTNAVRTALRARHRQYQVRDHLVERDRAAAALRELNETLEQRVDERTRELIESERRFRLLVEGVTDHAIFMLDPGGHVTNWNAGAERIKGYTAAEIAGEHISRFYTEEDRRAGVPEKALATAAAEGRYEAEGWRVRKDGSRFWASVVINAVRDEQGQLLGFAKITRDITERKATQEALEAAREQLYQAQKMEAVGQLTGGIAHDFNNLLTAIAGNLELIEDAARDDRRVRQLAAAAARATQRGARLTAGLLAFSRKQGLLTRTVDANALLTEFAPLVRRAVGETVRVDLSFEPALRSCRADTAQLQAAVLNLTINARDAMPKGGQIKISTRNADLGPADLAGNADAAPGPFVALAVEDTGHGMPPEILAKAFEPFFTTKEVGQGSGLGLSQVYGFARQLGGHVAIDSVPGQGTRVTLYLPGAATTVAPEEALPQQQARRVVPLTSTSVLVAEDDPDVREVTRATLQAIGCRVLTAGSGPEALAILERGEAIDLLFSDVMMPNGMSGIELARAARRVMPGLKVLLTSGNAAAALERHAAEDEFAVLAKPYRQAELAARIRAALDDNLPAAGQAEL